MQEIENSEAVTNIFGQWPSFHDGEIIRITLYREGEDGPTLQAQIHVFEMTNQVDSDGYYVAKNHTLVTLRFTEILLESLKWFNNQNVLTLLDIIEVDPNENNGCNFEVEMPSSYGCEAKFKCKRVIVENAQPFSKAV